MHKNGYMQNDGPQGEHTVTLDTGHASDLCRRNLATPIFANDRGRRSQIRTFVDRQAILRVDLRDQAHFLGTFGG